MAKKITVLLLDEAKSEFLLLEEKVRQEMEKGVTSSFHQTLLRSIKAKIEILKEKYDYGEQVQRNLIPRKYVLEYGVTNLWRVDLADYWRMVYTLRQPLREHADVEIITIILDVLDIVDHHRYDKIFGYRKR